MPSRRTFYLALGLVLVALAMAVATFIWRSRPLSGAVGEALIGGPFEMTDQTGRRVTEKDLLGHYSLIFFGYSYCPDICPTTLQVMMAARADLGEEGRQIVPIFVTVDPERDTVEQIRNYVGNFGPDLIGFTGSPADVERIAKAYRVYYRKAPSADGKDYAMDHSSILYLMGPDGKFRKHFTYTTDAAGLAAALREAMGS